MSAEVRGIDRIYGISSARLSISSAYDADMDENMYRRSVLDKIRKGQEAVEQARVVSSEDL